MKINFKSNFLSITSFPTIEVKDFTILTGKNGTGKTHLLNAIKNGNVEIEGIDKAEIVYYNYNTFNVQTAKPQLNQFQQTTSAWNSEKKQILQKINDFIIKASKKEAEKRTKPEQIIINHITQNATRIEEILESAKILGNLFKDKGTQDILKEMNNNPKLLPSKFFKLAKEYLELKGSPEELTPEKIGQKYKKIEEETMGTLKDENEELYNFIGKVLKNKNIFQINENDLESPNLFQEEIEEEEKEYQIEKAKNTQNKTNAIEYKEKVEYMGAKEFIEKHGNPPIEEINKVLNEYDCNGYQLHTNPKRELIGIDKKSIRIPIQLSHKKGYHTTFEQLSSGEKTLMALSLLIYKTRKNKIMPRVLLLDEVDSALHPSMIKRLLTVIRKLFIEEQGLKVIMVTHSPTTVALSPEDSLYAIENNGSLIIRNETKSNAINTLTEGIATINEEDVGINISYNISQTELPVLFTEGITDKIILETAWKKLSDNQEMPFYIQDCFDASFMRNLFLRGEDAQDGMFIKYPDKKFMALFDFDNQGHNDWKQLEKNYNLIEVNPRNCQTIKHPNKNAYAMLLPVPENEDIKKQVIKQGTETYENDSKLTIELLFYGASSLSSYFKKEQCPGGGEIIIFTGNKRSFATSLNNQPKEVFSNFVPLFKKLLEIIKT